MGHNFVLNMEPLRHHITISQVKYQTSAVNRYSFDYSFLLFSIYIVLRLLETLVLCCDKYRPR